MSLGIVGVDVDRPAIGGDRFVELALVLQRIAEVGMRLGIVGFDADRPAIGGDRFVELPWFCSALPRLECASA